MAINDATMTTETAADGTEYVAEMHSVVTETETDGTEIVADITTTADPDDPTQVEGHMTITETAPDGTETVTEITTSADGTMTVEEVEDKSFAEEVYEALFDTEAGDDAVDGEVLSEENSDEAEFVEITESDSTLETDAVDFTVGDEMFESSELPSDVAETPVTDAPFDSTYETAAPTFSETPVVDTSIEPTFETAETDINEMNETEAAELAEQEAHVQAAADAQESADEFIAKGDYAAAAEAREVAENESWEADDDTMLSAYDAGDLTYAADKQENAEYYEQQEAMHAQQGNYEAAREDASNAAYETSNADFYAGGDDHTGQADAEYTNMDNAVWQEGLRDDDLENAAWHAEMGNSDAAEASLDSAAGHQSNADYYGDLGEHGGVAAVYDPSSEVAAGGTYDSTFDATAVDTGFDSTVDTTAASTYDSGTDDV